MNLPENYEIDALIPEYTDKGDCTHIYLRDGRDFLLPITQRSVLRNIAIRSHCDMTSLRAEVAAHQRGSRHGLHQRRRRCNPGPR